MRAIEFLKEATTEQPAPNLSTLRVGSRGPAVVQLQQLLARAGYNLGAPGIDGKFGPHTEAAVRAFQHRNNLSIDGIAGPQTMAALGNTNIESPPPKASAAKSTATTIAPHELMPAAKKSAEQFLGSRLDDESWNMLIKAVTAEASNKTSEQAWVMGVILNRLRSGKWGRSMHSVLHAENQFQAVTGTKVHPGPSPNFVRGPNSKQLSSILTGAIEVLPNVDKTTMNFTAANTKAYVAGTNIGFRDKMIARGGAQIGQTIFGTV